MIAMKSGANLQFNRIIMVINPNPTIVINPKTNSSQTILFNLTILFSQIIVINRTVVINGINNNHLILINIAFVHNKTTIISKITTITTTITNKPTTITITNH